MADGPDDPKQKADKAWRWCERQWDRAPSPSQMVEAAVTASIAAAIEKSDCDMIDYVAASIDAHAADTRPLAEALAPVLERVARLEELAQFPTLMAENDALLQKMAAAPCATCGGARFVCGNRGWLKPCVNDNCKCERRRCHDCSKPAVPMCEKCGQKMVLRFWDRPGGPPGNGFACPDCSFAHGRAEGREAGIREAAEHIKQHGWTVAHNRVLALLAPCAICNGARWVCDVSVDGASYHRKPCPECSKPSASPEGEIVCTRHGQHRWTGSRDAVLDILAKKPEVTSG